MNWKRQLSIVLVLVGTMTAGCASIRARTDVLPRHGWTVYPGAQQGVKDIDAAMNGKLPYPGWMYVVLVPAFVLDLPIGAVFDTFALPYDIYRLNYPEEFQGKGKR